MADVAGGSRDQLEPLVRRHANALLTFIQRMTGDRHRSEELFQDVFLAVWQQRKRYQHWRPFRPWLYTIAINKVRSYLRSQAPMRSFHLLLDPPPLPSATEPEPGDLLVAAETATFVAQAVERLPYRQRVVVVLRVWSGMSFRQISELVGKTEGTVRSQMHHALSTLREHLEPRMR